MKKSLKKAAAAALAAVMALGMTACGGSSTGTTTAAAGSAAASAAETAASGDKIKVVLCVGRTTDLSFQQSAYEGVCAVQEQMGDKFDVKVVEMGDDTTKWLAGFYDACDGGADIVIGTGYQNKANFEQLGVEYPDTKFILFDQDIDYTKGDLSNVLSALFESSQSGYLAGMVAALYTTGEKAANPDKVIGFVGGMESTTINNFLVGYAEGAHAVDPEIKVMTAFVGNYTDTAVAKELANAQISEGADIVFQVAGGAGVGVLEAAAAKEGVMAIGVDSDQYETASDDLKPCVITSALKRLDNVVVKVCGDYAEDPSSVPFGSVHVYGLEDDAVGIVFNQNLTDSIGEANVKTVQDALAKIASGEITVSKAADLTADQIKNIVNGQ